MLLNPSPRFIGSGEFALKLFLPDLREQLAHHRAGLDSQRDEIFTAQERLAGSA